jgi:thiol:disulfide interchange protein
MPKLVQRFLFALLVTIPVAGTIAQAQGSIIYSDTADAHHDIAQALVTAQHEHKRVILDFGGNWCGDCKVLDIYFHQQPNLDLLENNFVIVHINVGHYDQNLDLADKYHVPLKRGVPEVVILDAHGKMLEGQQYSMFESMSKVDPSSVTQFLNQWKPKQKT